MRAVADTDPATLCMRRRTETDGMRPDDGPLDVVAEQRFDDATPEEQLSQPRTATRRSTW
jgi:hypothetical protein